MKKLAETIYALTGHLDAVARRVSTLLIFAMAAVVVIQVAARYLMRNPMVWTEELSRYLMIWASFLAMGSMIRNWDCVKVDFIVDRLGGRAGKAVRLLLRATVFLLCLVVALLCLRVYPAVTRNQVTPALRISMLIPQAGIIVGMIILTFQSLAALAAEYLGMHSPSHSDPAAAAAKSGE